MVKRLRKLKEGERFKIRYTWVEICFNPKVASSSDPDSEDFKRALTWYSSYRWCYGNKNSFLDGLLKIGVEVAPLTNVEYRFNNRVWLKWVRKYGW